VTPEERSPFSLSISTAHVSRVLTLTKPLAVSTRSPRANPLHSDSYREAKRAVSFNMQQAARVSKNTAFLDQGVLIEFDETEKVFTQPGEQRTADYITGRSG
jgi:hypothetical protein